MIDTHCHINDEAYCNNAEEYINEAKNAGVSAFLIVGFDVKSSRIAIEIAEKYPNCYAAVGIHPSDVKKAEKDAFEQIDEMASNKKVIAIGEIGLDYYWDKEQSVRDYQKETFIKQIEIANKHNLPISIHCRDGIEDCLNILKEHHVNKAGIMHCYAGSVESAQEFIKLGFLLGFGGTVTFKNSVKPKEVIASIPSTYYVLETDAPYLTPDPYRGKPNHSKYLYLVRNKISELRNITPEQVEKESSENFVRMFDL